MKRTKVAALTAAMLFSVSIQAEELTGKVKLACEATLCLSTGSPPNECSPSLSEYFSIDFDDFRDTIKGRLNFLNLCPVSDQTPQMKSLVNAIANGAGRCDAASLNATLVTYTYSGMGYSDACISSTKPSYCTTWEGHEFSTELKGGAHYVIDPPKTTFSPYGGIGGSSAFMGFGGYGSTTTKSCGHWVNN
ncbi:TrbM/KikA/MpfK family conjugal transfer protein [Methylotenera sp.]|uniref:TrbM/KikA/MpfK family conjugal transfer protein n=1 Tax=Methylotenera sp. TaxID=2051956 RepID=UPI00248A5D63|nr:TrbM/KikA/MpfK family conjugal transfer protein [Methylotenera sp.]MDI1298629.1 TrbM/KikA/MpfK family conjugal transfer protein [Methylotenera sp.]